MTVKVFHVKHNLQGDTSHPQGRAEPCPRHPGCAWSGGPPPAAQRPVTPSPCLGATARAWGPERPRMGPTGLFKGVVCPGPWQQLKSAQAKAKKNPVQEPGYEPCNWCRPAQGGKAGSVAARQRLSPSSLATGNSPGCAGVPEARGPARRRGGAARGSGGAAPCSGAASRRRAGRLGGRSIRAPWGALLMGRSPTVQALFFRCGFQFFNLFFLVFHARAHYARG